MKKLLFVILAIFIVFCSVMFLPKNTVQSNALRCPTPASIMLHSYFGSYSMEKLAEKIISEGYVTMTYRQVYDLWDSGKCPPENAILVSLDDLSGAWLRKSLVNMIKAFTDCGLVLTVGVVSYTPDISKQDPKIWEYFKEIKSAGVEIASHSTHHYCLTMLDRERKSIELHESYEIICQNLGECPSTFILPFGNGWDNEDVIDLAKGYYRSLVSIDGTHDFGGDVFIMRRVNPPDDIDSLKSFLQKHFPQIPRSSLKRNRMEPIQIIQ